MMRPALALFCVLCALWPGGGLLAQEEPTVPYFQSAAFNAPIPVGWQDQSRADIAQFYQAAAQATIRTRIVPAGDVAAAVEQDLQAWLGSPVDSAVYQGKVNLADGTWRSLVYQIDDDTTASVMARPNETGVIVISFVEAHSAAKIIMLAIAQADQNDAQTEMTAALQTFNIAGRADLSEPQTLSLSSGEWLLQSSAAAAVMGRAVGNDSYIALAEGVIESLPELADAYHSSLLGFYITPDTSPFLWLGLAASFGILGILLFSFVWRRRGLQKELALIQTLTREAD